MRIENSEKEPKRTSRTEKIYILNEKVTACPKQAISKSNC